MYNADNVSEIPITRLQSGQNRLRQSANTKQMFKNNKGTVEHAIGIHAYKMMIRYM